MKTSKIPTMMNAVRLHTADGPAGLVYEQVETPQPKGDEVLVRVHAASITRDELDWPVNRLPAIPSYEFSGVVSRIGRKVEEISVGEEVYALSPFDRDGAAADYIVIQKEFLALRPKTIDHVQSASRPLAALITKVSLARQPATWEMFRRIVGAGTTRSAALAPSRASRASAVMATLSGILISGKREGSGPSARKLSASDCVLACNLTSSPFSARRQARVIPQLVVPTIAIFCMVNKP